MGSVEHRKSYRDFIVSIIEDRATVASIKEFIDKGFSINFRSGGGSSPGATPLHCAIENKNLVIVKALVEAGADVNAQDAKGAPPLTYAAQQGSQEIILYLLENDANLITALENTTDLKAREALVNVAVQHNFVTALVL